MKPLHIGLLIAAGAIGGALVMKVAQRPQPVEAPAIVAKTQTPAPLPVPPPVEPAVSVPPAAPPAQVAEARPSPVVPRRETPKPPRSYTKHDAPARPPAQAPVTTAQAQPAPAPQPPVTSPSVEPIAPAPEPVSNPPARPEPEHVTPPPPPPPEPQKVTLNAGTLIPVRLVDGLSSERNSPGDLFTATLDKELVVDGFVIAERGARVEGRVVSSDKGGRVRGVASLGVELKRLRLSDGQWIALNTGSFTRNAEQSHRDDAAKVGAGAAIGAVIGAIAGGGKGAAIGAGAGGAAGAGTVAATRGKAATLPSETRISFRVNTPVTVTERR